MKPCGQHPDGKEPPKTVAALLEQVDRDGGRVLAVYREPVGNHWQAFCLLPLLSVAPTPYQRDLSPTHAKRLTDVVRKIDRFVDPIVVVSPRPGVYWTPNGHHRRTAPEKLKAEMVPAILIPEARGQVPEGEAARHSRGTAGAGGGLRGADGGVGKRPSSRLSRSLASSARLGAREGANAGAGSAAA